jgi:exodeoxyribonuclease-5
MMPNTHHPPALPDAGARQRALLDYDATLLVEAGAGSGKTALMAGRVALMLAHGIQPRDIVAITFTEAAAAELLERIQRFVDLLKNGTVPPALEIALPAGLSAGQRAAIATAAAALDEITCTTIHGFCQQLVKPYPIEAGIDPGATIVDPATADLAYQDLMTAWLSTRFGRTRGDDGLGRIPPMGNLGGEDDFFAELLAIEPDEVVSFIGDAANFFRIKRTARAPGAELHIDVLRRLSQGIRDFADWYAGCGIAEPATAECVADLAQFRAMLDDVLGAPITGRVIVRLLRHLPPNCCHGTEPRFKAWQNKGKWQAAAAEAGFGRARGEQFCAAAKAIYDRCSDDYQSFTANIAGAALARFVGEFDGLRDLYADYKRQAALLDFDDLLHHARDLLARDPGVRQASPAAIRASSSTSFRIPIPCRPKSCGCSAETETRANTGLPAGCVRAACFWWETPNRRSTASAAPTLTPIWKQNAPFSRKMPAALSRSRQTSVPAPRSSLLPTTVSSRSCQRRPDS